MRPLWRIFRRFLEYRWTLLGGFGSVPLSWWLDIQITLVIGAALNALSRDATAGVADLDRVLWTLLGLAVGRSLFRFLHRWWVVGVSRRVERDLKQDLFDRLTRLSLGFHQGQRSGDIASRITSDVEAVRMLLGPGVMYVLGTFTAVGFGIGELWKLDADLTAVLAIPLALLAVGVTALMPALHRRSLAVQERIADVTHHAQEVFGGIRVVKGYGIERQQGARFEATSRANHDAQLALAHTRGLVHTFTRSAHDLCFVPILLLGGGAMIDGGLEIGTLFVFVDLVMKVFWPVLSLGWIAGMYPRAAASARRLEELLHSDQLVPEPVDPAPLEPPHGHFELEGVGFTYPGATRPSLADLTFEVPAGATLGVVGPTGCGKTTLLHLFERLYEPTTGSVRLDGRDLATCALRPLRRAIGHVTQDGFLFSVPYRENVELGSDMPLDDAHLWPLLELASIADEVRALPEGPETLLGERGVNLSGGQRQRTAIARALAGDPPILLLDDALSAVDTATERKLLDHLRDARAERTVVVAAHRLSVVRDADAILVLEGGRATGLGTHEELLTSNAWYADAWERQQAREELEAFE